ncbi:MAG: chemotaxis protein CheW [Candidatus Omnitrophica bacterium]|nr:chemotaxis protein CheW [Candidatus Omnitrophota bacterium]
MPFDKTKFLAQFKAETREHLQKLSLGLIKLEKKPKNKELLDAMMREAHTIKGSATMMGFKRITDIAHRMENGLENGLKGNLILAKIHFDALLKCTDAIEPLLEDKVCWEDSGVARPFVDNLCQEVDDIFSGKIPAKPAAKKETRKAARSTEAREASVPAASVVQEESIRVDLDKLDKLVNISGELLISKIRLNGLIKDLSLKSDSYKELDENYRNVVKDLGRVTETMDFLTSDMQDEVMKVRMVPVAYLFNSFPRAMRELAQKEHKEIDFEVKGQDTELDKSIIEEIKDPIMHLLRNCIDHGIETPAERKAKAKPEAGRITLSAIQEGSQIIIEVSDDGNGIDTKRIVEIAKQKGLVENSQSTELTQEQVYQLLFLPGFSTKDEVTETSGRGVGLDVVREAVKKLKGRVEVISEVGSGSTFRMNLPLTLAIKEVLLVGSGSQVFAIPVDSVVETIRVQATDIKTVETKEAINIRGQIMPLLRLNSVFGLPAKGIFEKRFIPLVVVQSVEKRIGLLVDQLMGRQEIISKNMGDPLKHVKDIAGATIMENGRVILILDVASIIESAESVMLKKSVPLVKPAQKAKKRKAILLAEDVMSTAMLEKNILESVGYSVVIARDGQEALERSAQEKFDLVITDVLMPRMDGFDLTEKLKKDKYYNDIPIIIVTTRENETDKRRGLEAGASAYILKSEFTSDTLLDAIERLIG